MHEMNLMRTVVDMVVSSCEGKNVKSVRKAYLTIGEMRDVVEEYIPGLFKFLARDTIAANAEVVMERIPMMVRCLGPDVDHPCGEIFHIDTRDPTTWECPRCHTYQRYRLFCGDEFRIERLEVEAADLDGTEANAARS